MTVSLLARGGDAQVPSVTYKRRARAIVLAQHSRQRTVVEIREAVLPLHPDLFPSQIETTRFVDSVLRRDSQ